VLFWPIHTVEASMHTVEIKALSNCTTVTQ
jgi:hypothetical protein